MTSIFTTTKKLFLGMTLLIPLLFFALPAHAEVLSPGVITECGELAAPGTYILDNSTMAFDQFGPCFTITSSDVVISAGGTGLNGDIVADNSSPGQDGYSFTLENIYVNGSVSMVGGTGGNLGTLTLIEGNLNSGGAVVTGNVDTTSSYSNFGTVTGNITFRGLSCPGVDFAVQGDAIFINDSYGYNGNCGGVSPLAYSPTVGGIVRFAPATENETVVRFDIGTQGQADDCGGSPCVWNVNTTNWSFGSSTPIWNFYGNSGNASTIKVPPSGRINFYDSSFNGDPSSGGGTVDGDAYFYNSSYNYASTVTGNAYFHDESFNGAGTVQGNAIFYDASINRGGTIMGDAIFKATAYFRNAISHQTNPQLDTVLGTVYFVPESGDTITFNVGDVGELEDNCGNDANETCIWGADTSTWVFGTSTSITPIWNFYANSFADDVFPATAQINFYDYSYNVGTLLNVESPIVFNNNSNNGGDLNDAVFNDQSYNNNYVSGDATFTSDMYSHNQSSQATSPQLGQVDGAVYFIPASGTTTVTFNVGVPQQNDSCNSAACVWGVDTKDWIFGTSTPVSAVWNFFGNSYSNADLLGDAYFYDTSYNDDVITGDAVFNDQSYQGFGGVLGSAFINTTYYDSLAPSGGVFTISGTNQLSGFFYGNVYGSDGLLITQYVFNDDAYLYDGDLYSVDVVFNNNASNQSYVTSLPYGWPSAITFTPPSASGLPPRILTWSSVYYGWVDEDLFDNAWDWNIATDGFYIYYGDGSLDIHHYSSESNSSNWRSTVSVSGFNSIQPTQMNAYQDDIGWGISGVAFEAAGYDTSLTKTTTFNDGAYNAQTVFGQSVFNDSSHNSSNLSGLGTFNDDSYNDYVAYEDVIFRDNSNNEAGQVFGDADVYSPVVKPLSGVVMGTIRYHGYPAFYFNDQAPGAAGDGDWGNPLNWWTDEAFTIPAGEVPDISDDTFIYSDVTSDTSTSSAAAQSVTFQGGAQNNVTIVVADKAYFNATSTNNGNIIGEAIFSENGSQNDGAVSVPTETWQPATGTSGYGWYDIASNAVGDRLLAVDGNSGSIWTSSDNGATWSEASGTNGYYWRAVASNALGDKLFAVNGGPGSIWTSSDYGISWAPASGTAGHEWLGVASNSTGEYVYAVDIDNDGADGSIWRSSDYGTNWSEVVSTNGQSWSTIATNATGDRVVAAVYSASNETPGSIWTSSDYGANWSEVASTSGNYWTSVSSNAVGDRLVATNRDLGDTGFPVWTSSDYGATWEKPQNLNGYSWIDVASNAAGDKLIAAELGGSVWNSSNYGVTWSAASGTDGLGWLAVASNGSGDLLFAVDYYITQNIWRYVSPANNLGPVTRLFTESVATIRNFLTEGGRNDWILIAQNAVVDLTNAIYSRITNIFKAIGNGSFITNPTIDGGASVVPQIVVTVPANGTTTVKWVPSIAWDTAETCEYKMDGAANYIPLDCEENGADLPRPTAGSHTLYLRGTDTLGNLTEKTVSFTYNNVLPVWTSCGADLLDESTREYYYLAENVVGDCTATVSTELRGALSTTTFGYTVNGDIVANAISTNGLNITLKNISVTGTVSANGATGGHGGTITIATSTTGNVYSDGGSKGNGNGGNGGTVTITNSLGATTETTVYSRGGNSTVCGNGGNGGSVNIVNSSNYTKVNTGGTGTSCGSGGSSGSSGGGQTTGQYIPPSTDEGGEDPTPTVPPTGPVRSAASVNYIPFSFSDSQLTIPVSPVRPLKLAPLPVFGGSGVNAFSFESIMLNFVRTPLPTALEEKLPIDLKAYLASQGIATANDLLVLRTTPRVLTPPTGVVTGLIEVSVNGHSSPITAVYSTSTPTYLAEQVSVVVGSSFTISLSSTTAQPISAYFLGGYQAFYQGVSGVHTVSLKAPDTVGMYSLTTLGSPLPLFVRVVPEVPQAAGIEKVKKQSVWSIKIW